MKFTGGISEAFTRRHCIRLVLRKLNADRAVEVDVETTRRLLSEVADPANRLKPDLADVLTSAADLCKCSTIQRVTCTRSASCERNGTEECPATRLKRFIRDERTVCSMSAAIRRCAEGPARGTRACRSIAIQLGEEYLDALSDYLESERETLSVVLQELVAEDGRFRQ